MLPVVETLPKAAYYLIQRRDSRQTPLAESLITQFRREAEINLIKITTIKIESARHQTDSTVHTVVRPFADPTCIIRWAGLLSYNSFFLKEKDVE